MKVFQCQQCGQPIYFENTACERCHSSLGFLPDDMVMTALQPQPEGDAFRALANPALIVRFCKNSEFNACNWLVTVDSGEDFCPSCQTNRTIPDVSDAERLECWQLLQVAKNRLIYGLMRLRLPIVSKLREAARGVAFDFLAGEEFDFREKVITGHSEGLITINIAEADPAMREQHRENMAEPYRTLLGHFRHEIGHYYWERLIQGDEARLASFRQMFGDEQLDYAQALDAHYNGGPPADWQQHFVSAYASSHPWEDWAETWAHYLHIVDTLETAHAFGIRIRPREVKDPTMEAVADFDPYRAGRFEDLIEVWLPLTYAVNSLNRSMGQPDLYPFVLPPEGINKLTYIHELISHSRT
jgi:hypothetical protein